MRTFINIGIILLLFSCGSRTENKNNSQMKVVAIQEKNELFYDYLTFDSILINCKVKPFSTYDTLVFELGKPDTIIEYKNDVAYIEDPFSYIKYDSMEFHRSEKNNTYFYNMKLGETNNVLCYKGEKFNKSTTLESIASIFPKSYSRRDTITIGDERLVAVRFHTSKLTTDDKWIMLFLDRKLKYFDYYDAND